jgi:hypothetical protein
MQATRALAVERKSVLQELIGEQTVRVWDHLPADDAYDAGSGYRWFYHCHRREARTSGEHGHFHLFSCPQPGEGVTHLIAISVSDRGLPLGLFTTNRWVTDERWQVASRVLGLIARFRVSSPAILRRVHEWLRGCVRAFAPQIRALVEQRDARLATLRRSMGSDVLEDRRVAVLSRCRNDVHAQAAALDRWLPVVVRT